jgi:uncharacterized protein with PQ loop repeat
MIQGANIQLIILIVILFTTLLVWKIEAIMTCRIVKKSKNRNNHPAVLFNQRFKILNKPKQERNH